MLEIIAREEYNPDGYYSWTEETYWELMKTLRRHNFPEYIRYVHMYEEVRNRKLEDYYSEHTE
jgi:hypothetical protein